MGSACGREKIVCCGDRQPYDPANATCEQKSCSTSSSTRVSLQTSVSSKPSLGSKRSAVSATGVSATRSGEGACKVSKTLSRRIARRTALVSHTKSGVDVAYDVKGKVGEGTQGSVFKARGKATGTQRAIKKMLKKGKVNATEIEIMKRMDHPNIVKLFETFEDRFASYLVMEFCSGGDLFDKIVQQGSLSEREAAIVMEQILRAVNYLHRNDVAHRDLKPENFIFSTKAPIAEDNLLKLIDFGIACECGPSTCLKEQLGTPYYMAPQVVTRSYDKKCDIWSCGVIMFTLLSGGVPFTGASDTEVLAKVQRGIVRYQKDTWRYVSDDAHNLLRKLLTRNAKDRINSEDALSHDWIRFHAPRAEAKLQDSLVGSLRNFWRLNQLKRAALTVIASEMNDGQIRGLRQTFVALDSDGDGLLTLADIAEAMGRAGVDLPPDCADFLDSLGATLVLDYSEFLAATICRKNELCEKACRVAFATFSTAGNDVITKAEIERAFRDDTGETFVMKRVSSQSIIDRYGTPGNNGLDFDGFRRMMSDPDISPCPGREVRRPRISTC